MNEFVANISDVNYFLRIRRILKDNAINIAVEVAKKIGLKYNYMKIDLSDTGISVQFFCESDNIYTCGGCYDEDDYECDRVYISYDEIIEPKECFNKLIKSREKEIEENKMSKLEDEIEELRKGIEDYENRIKLMEDQHNKLIFQIT